jgi:3-deoxy-manno-octulosonate cytidylyltransferase (CMP-KDO synthetase)
MRAIVIVPARLAATRLPRKPLLRETGKFMVEHVWEQAKKAKLAARVVIATDSREILDACRSFGAEAVMTSDQHRSGTDRCAEAWQKLQAEGERADFIINVQGDEPELDPANVDRLVELMAEKKSPMGTLAEVCDDPAQLALPQVVKVVLDHEGTCLYFSRAKIPSTDGADAAKLPHRSFRHVGIYAFTPDFLVKFPTLAPAEIEKVERLEQLRALFHGYRIRAAVVASTGARGIDTPEDYAAFVARHRVKTGHLHGR